MSKAIGASGVGGVFCIELCIFIVANNDASFFSNVGKICAVGVNAWGEEG